jgi:hypothetical protein
VSLFANSINEEAEKPTTFQSGIILHVRVCVCPIVK